MIMLIPKDQAKSRGCLWSDVSIINLKKKCHYLLLWKVIKIRYVNISRDNFTMVELRMKNYHTSSTLSFRTKSMNNFLGGVETMESKHLFDSFWSLTRMKNLSVQRCRNSWLLKIKQTAHLRAPTLSKAHTYSGTHAQEGQGYSTKPR